jgi:LuxR family transcriptional regulator, maltose regulon positive regulatory protein
MADALLETKFHVPRRRRGLVTRPRLSQRVAGGAESPLTLVSAPAGFGKTTLLAEWVAAGAAVGQATAWLSLDQRDNDAGLYWTYVVAAVRTADETIGAGALSLLESQQASMEAVVSSLLNDLQTLAKDVVLVLDDYHVIEASEVHEGMTFLLEHLPPRVHVVIAGRADPPLPLARSRGQGDLAEIRAADLRFTPDEAAAYLTEVMGLALTAHDVAALEERTEGWIAALQLAALSLQGRDDVAGFIAGFAGDDRYIVDYLVEEVLARQPEQVRRFLLQTSILERLSGPLCDAVTGQDGGKAQLAELKRGNLFLVPLDDRRQWYRYHQLFADVLRTHLLDEQPGDVPLLHARASGWYEQNGRRPEAIRHALAAGDFERAADLVELAIPAMRRGRQEAAMRAWLQALPDEVIEVRPVLSVGLAGAILAVGDFEPGRLEEAERWLDATQRWLDSTTGAAQLVVDDNEELRRIPGMIDVYRAALDLAGGDVSGAIGHAAQALELLPADDHLGRAAAAGFVGLTSWATGDLDAAHVAWSECVAGLRRAGHIADTLGCTIALADIRITQGRLGEAMRTYEQALQLATEQGGVVLPGTADMYVGMSELHCEWDDLTAATQSLMMSQELGEQAGLAQNRYRWRVAMARVRQTEGDLPGALDLLNEAQRLYVGDYFPNVRPVPAMRARVLVASGEWGAARDWVGERGLTVADDLSYLSEFEHITLARVLLAQYAAQQDPGRLDEVMDLLERLLQGAEEGDRTGSVIEILVTQAVAHQTRGDKAAAVTSLQRALRLAGPEGYVRVFVDDGPPMASLLAAVGKQSASAGIAPDYLRRLLRAVDRTHDAAPLQQDLIEPLSERELDVLRLLRTDLDGPDIARQLFISLNTLRTHTKNIYAKLGVNNRRAAVRRGAELDLEPHRR